MNGGRLPPFQTREKFYRRRQLTNPVVEWWPVAAISNSREI
jgi:hypothetical protein